MGMVLCLAAFRATGAPLYKCQFFLVGADLTSILFASWENLSFFPSMFKGYIPSFLNANIKAVSWLPQNDLLAHKDIKAFVSHVGHHSLYESAYHGVPVVAFPLFGDQPSNAKKVEHFGLGIAVDHQTVNAQQLLEAIERVVSEPRYL